MSLSIQDNGWIVALAYFALVGAGLMVDLALILRLLIHPSRWAMHTYRLQQRPWTRGTARRRRAAPPRP